jgi:hypothetical protein
MDSLLEDLVGVRFAQQLPQNSFGSNSVVDAGPTLMRVAASRADEVAVSLAALLRRLDRNGPHFARSAERLLV